MDERDHEWLEKNNEAARGEGTSAQGSISTSGTSTRSGAHRSAKSKGKEPDVSQAIAMSEDEFELLMGVFEKVTHEKTEFLHHVSDQPSLPYNLHINFISCRALRRAWLSRRSLTIKRSSRRHCLFQLSPPLPLHHGFLHPPNSHGWLK